MLELQLPPFGNKIKGKTIKVMKNGGRVLRHANLLLPLFATQNAVAIASNIYCCVYTTEFFWDSRGI